MKKHPSIAFLTVDFLGNKSFSINYYIGMLLHFAKEYYPEGQFTLYSHKGSEGPSYSFEEIMADYRIEGYPEVAVKQVDCYDPSPELLDEIAAHDLTVCTIYFWGDALEAMRRRKPQARVLYWLPSVLWHEYMIVKQTKWYKFDHSLESQRKTVAASDHVMFNSESDRFYGLRYFSNLISDSSSAFPIPLVTEQPKARPLASGGEEIVFGTAGRWEYRKGYQFIVEAFFRYYAEHGKGKLRIMSNAYSEDAELEVAMEQKTVRKFKYLEAQGAIELVDWSKERSTYINFLQNCDVMMLASLYDPFNIIGYDSLNLEIPLILSKFCGIEEVIDESPYLRKVNPLDVNNLFEVMQELGNTLSHHPDKFPEYQIKHSWHDMMHKTFEIYDQVIKTPAVVTT